MGCGSLATSATESVAEVARLPPHLTIPMKQLTLLLAFLVQVLPVRADDEFWSSSRRTAAASAAQVAAVGDPWTAAALRLSAFDRELWDEPPLFPDRVPPLSARLLSGVRDDKPFLDYQKFAP